MIEVTLWSWDRLLCYIQPQPQATTQGARRILSAKESNHELWSIAPSMHIPTMRIHIPTNRDNPWIAICHRTMCPLKYNDNVGILMFKPDTSMDQSALKSNIRILLIKHLFSYVCKRTRMLWKYMFFFDIFNLYGTEYSLSIRELWYH